MLLDRSLEELPLFRLSDTSDDAAISYTTDDGGRWRVLASPGDRLPGTFDQDVYVELMRRFQEAGEPADGALSFTLHAFLRSMGRQVDGRTYEQLRGALTRLERTMLQSERSYFDAAVSDAGRRPLHAAELGHDRASPLTERDQLALFPTVVAAEPGEARVVISPIVRQNSRLAMSSSSAWLGTSRLPSPVARRLYRLIEVARAGGALTWRVSLDRLREQLPLSAALSVPPAAGPSAGPRHAQGQPE